MTSINEQERKVSALTIIKNELGTDVYNYCIANKYFELTDELINNLLDIDKYTVTFALSDVKIDISGSFLDSLINLKEKEPYEVVEAKNHAIDCILPKTFNSWIMYDNLESRDLNGFKMMGEYKFKINKKGIRQYCQFDNIISLLKAFINIKKIQEFVSEVYLQYNNDEFIKFVEKI